MEAEQNDTYVEGIKEYLLKTESQPMSDEEKKGFYKGVVASYYVLMGMFMKDGDPFGLLAEGYVPIENRAETGVGQ